MRDIVTESQVTVSELRHIILAAKTCGSLCAPPRTKISGHGSLSGSDLDMNRWVWSVLTSRSRDGSIFDFIFVVFTVTILSPLKRYSQTANMGCNKKLNIDIKHQQTHRSSALLV